MKSTMTGCDCIECSALPAQERATADARFLAAIADVLPSDELARATRAYQAVAGRPSLFGRICQRLGELGLACVRAFWAARFRIMSEDQLHSWAFRPSGAVRLHGLLPLKVWRAESDRRSSKAGR